MIYEKKDSEGDVDLTRVKPLLFDVSSRKYWSPGRPSATAGVWAKSKK